MPRKRKRIDPRRQKLWRRRMSVMAIFLAVGAGLTVAFRQPQPAMVVAVSLCIPVGLASRSVFGGTWRAAGLGLLAGLGSMVVLLRFAPAGQAGGLAWFYMLCSAGACGLAGGLFAHLARRRRQQWEDEWQDAAQAERQAQDRQADSPEP